MVLATLLAAGAVLCYIATAAVWNGFGTAPSYYDDVLCREVMTDAMYNALYLVTEPDSSMQPEYAYRQEIQFAGFAYEVYYGDPASGILLGSGGQREGAAVGREATITVETTTLPLSSDAFSSGEAGEEELTALPDETAGYYTVVGRLYLDLPSYGNFHLSQLLYSIIHPISGASTVLFGLSCLGTLLCLIFLLCALDVAMVVSLLKPGDERKKLILWKTSTYTFSVVVAWLFLDVILNFGRGYEPINPFSMLSVIAAMYFITLLYQKRKHGG